MADNFMLCNKTAEKLYERAGALPIIDYHCHLSVKDIAENKPLQNISRLWLAADHYKWRLMRMGGVEERFITGGASDEEKFQKYISVLSYAVGSPLYHWSKLELKKYFGVDEEITPANAVKIYEAANAAVEERRLTPQKILSMSGVESMCVVEDCQTADLSLYNRVRQSGCPARITPLMRVDKLLLKPLTEVKKTAPAIIDMFAAAGCGSADFGAEWLDENDEDSIAGFAYLLKECYKRGFAVQVHIGAMRNVNAAAFQSLGPDAGYDSISEKPYLSALAKAFNTAGNVGKTVLFNLNPADNAKVASLAADFAGGGIPGKVQMGVAWWFNDHCDGINRFFTDVSALSYLPASVGMLTDSRSILSYVRHDYFRRLLCSFVGRAAERGEFTTDFEILQKIVCDVSYNNVKKYLG